MPELVSVTADLSRSIDLAARHGFAGVDTGSGVLAAPDLDIDAVRDRMRETGIRPGYFGMTPGRVPVPEADWAAALAQAPLVARRAQALGFRRAALVLLPFHETLPFDDAFAEHVARLNALTAILDDHGIALGLEYVSPLSRRSPYQHHFIHDLKGLLRLCDALDSPTVGILLDTFHWHCAGESVADLEALPASKVVVVHVNDAPPVPLEEQVILRRALPGDTGVIDIAGFVRALETIGYDGPVTCEPMADAIRALSPDADEDVILTRVSESLDRFLLRPT